MWPLLLQRCTSTKRPLKRGLIAFARARRLSFSGPAASRLQARRARKMQSSGNRAAGLDFIFRGFIIARQRERLSAAHIAAAAVFVGPFGRACSALSRRARSHGALAPLPSRRSQRGRPFEVERHRKRRQSISPKGQQHPAAQFSRSEASALKCVRAHFVQLPSLKLVGRPSVCAQTC